MMAGVLVVAALIAAAPAQAAPPLSMAAIGDSYTAGLFSGSPCSASAACPANSWSTGTTAASSSHYRRLLALDSRITGRNFNAAVSGRKVSDLDRQAQLVVERGAEYVTVMLGLNDSCRESEAAMTSVATFRSQFAAGMGTLTRGLPAARILVASIPDAERLRTTFAGNAAARDAWASQDICRVALANPQSTAAVDVARRSRARQRVTDFNRQLSEVCAQHANCRYDGGAVFEWAFATADFVTRDYFHLSTLGQAGLAAVTWTAGFDFGSTPPPPPPGTGYAATILADGPVSYWRFGERSGTVASNSVSGPAGRYVGPVRLGLPGAIAGDPDTAVLLNGSTAYVTVPNAPSLATGDAFTLEAWVKRDVIGRSQGLFNKGSRSYQVYLDATDRLVLRQVGIGEIARATVGLTDRAGAHHIAVTKHGSAVRLYIDGIDRTGPVANRTISNTTSQLVLGSGAGTLAGKLDEVAVYRRALDAATVSRHHSAGRE